MGENFKVVLSKSHPVAIQARLYVDVRVNSDQIKEQAIGVLYARLSGLPTRQHPEIPPWPLGRKVEAKEVKGWLAGVDGVVAVDNCYLDKKHDTTELLLGWEELAVCVRGGMDLEIKVSGGHGGMP